MSHSPGLRDGLMPTPTTTRPWTATTCAGIGELRATAANMSWCRAGSIRCPSGSAAEAGTKQAFGGWQVNGTAQIQSGLPVNPTISNDQAGTGSSNQRPLLIGDPYSGGNVGGNQVLNTFAFGVPGLSTFGNLGAYNIFLPRWINVNSSVVKSFYTGNDGRYKWDVRFEMYDVANHLSVSAVNTGSIAINAQGVYTTNNWGAKNGT